MEKEYVRRPGIEPGSIAWKATMLTFTPRTLWFRDAIKISDCDMSLVVLAVKMIYLTSKIKRRLFCLAEAVSKHH